MSAILDRRQLARQAKKYPDAQRRKSERHHDHHDRNIEGPLEHHPVKPQHAAIAGSMVVRSTRFEQPRCERRTERQRHQCRDRHGTGHDEAELHEELADLPSRKEIGTNAISVAEVATTAKVTWRVPRQEAFSGLSPSSIRRWMFSSTTIASSTTRPMARISAGDQDVDRVPPWRT